MSVDVICYSYPYLRVHNGTESVSSGVFAHGYADNLYPLSSLDRVLQFELP
jgi:hypothetical protein